MPAVEIRPLEPGGRADADALARRHWGGTRILDVAGSYESSELPGAVALVGGRFAGALTWSREGDLLRIITLASVVEGRGVGRALLAAAEAEARATGAARVVVSTSNANMRALALYQRNGYRLAALHLGAIDDFRRLKPEIALADSGIPLRDMIELEKPLG